MQRQPPGFRRQSIPYILCSKWAGVSLSLKIYLLAGPFSIKSKQKTAPPEKGTAFAKSMLIGIL
jgi:hypothetical protein